MLFNSVEFIFLFLPLTLGGAWLLLRVGNRVTVLWLLAASVFFYGWWSPRHVVLLLASIAFNYTIGSMLVRGGGRFRGLLLAIGVGSDLALLAFFKYADFLLASLTHLPGVDLEPLGILLPIGISFYTFTQIAFLVDAWRGEVKQCEPLSYALFVTYFPHLIAGPILHHKEMIPQFRALAPGRIAAEDLAVGITIFVIGLFKKVILADGVARFVPLGFEPGLEPTLAAAWAGALAFALQLYFDFSGYSDMAVGMSRMFGVHLPLNFASPYKATSIIEFWRRWHMTLSRFLRDYLYVPLGGNRLGPRRRHANLMATMLLGGLWHGAGWTFVLWGGLHGAFLIVNHFWREWRTRHGLRGGSLASALAAGALTFLAVVVGWVPFRAVSLEQAGIVLAGVAGLNGISAPHGAAMGLEWAWILGLLLLVWLAPNTQEILARHLPQMADRASDVIAPIWRPTAWHAAAVVAAALVAIGHLGKVSEFLYFQF